MGQETVKICPVITCYILANYHRKLMDRKIVLGKNKYLIQFVLFVEMHETW